MNILEYDILGSNSADQLSGKVVTHIAKGWQPFGSLQVVCPVLDEVPAPAYYQAIVRLAPAAGSVAPTSDAARASTV